MQTYPNLTSSLYFTMSKANKQQQQGGFLTSVMGILEGATKAASGAVGGVLGTLGDMVAVVGNGLETQSQMPRRGWAPRQKMQAKL